MTRRWKNARQNTLPAYAKTTGRPTRPPGLAVPEEATINRRCRGNRTRASSRHACPAPSPA
eukprot:5142904-Lingulodinium_polyedra.AAC.1